MPLNQPKTYAFVPKPVGPVKMVTRSSLRSRLWTGGSFWRSHERGEAANAIKLTCVEDLSIVGSPEGLFVVHHTVLKPSESIFVSNMTMPQVDLYALNLNWNEEVRVLKVGDSLVARKYGIRWQIAGGEDLLVEYGTVTQGRVLASPDISFRVGVGPADWPTNGVLYFRPRTHRYTLATTSVTDPESMLVSTGWDIDALRSALNVSDTWVRMPERGTGGETGPVFGAEDKMDTETVDADFLSAFPPTNMAGGDGLPIAPVGFNTGPDRVLVHLNYAERDDGSLGELNQVFEWEGDSAAVGSWVRYA